MFNLQGIVILFVTWFVIPRLTFLPSSVHTLLIVLGPFLLPKLVNLFNTARATSRSVPVRPAPLKVKRALNLLFVSAAACLLLSLPKFAPEDVFLRTGTRLQTANSVLFERLRLQRPGDALTEADEVLQDRFTKNQANRLIYLAYGGDTLLNCVWCTTGQGQQDGRNFIFYHLPKIILPHMLHLIVLGLATSSFIVGTEGSRFRIHTTIAGLAFMVAEVWSFAVYDVTANKRSVSTATLDIMHIRLRTYRLLGIAAADALLALILWATSTNRWLAKPPSIAERLETTTRQAEETVNKLRALGLVTNSINRDPALRGVREEYWQTENKVMSETIQEEEVVEQINRAINSLDLQSLEGRVGDVADGILAGIDGMRASQQLAAATAG